MQKSPVQCRERRSSWRDTRPKENLHQAGLPEPLRNYAAPPLLAGASGARPARRGAALLLRRRLPYLHRVILFVGVVWFYALLTKFWGFCARFFFSGLASREFFGSRGYQFVLRGRSHHLNGNVFLPGKKYAFSYVGFQKQIFFFRS